MLSLDDTIAAVSTAVGEGGIGIVRMSGPQALAIARRLLVPNVLHPFHLCYAHVVDPVTAEVVDEVLAAYMPAPRTYTRQDVVEIDAHGGIVAVQRVLALCLAHGARLAEPGEFTLRAFLNGRLDLAQAESVLDVVRAKTDRALRTAVGQLAGRLSARVRPVRERLVAVLAYVVATLDFEADMLGAERDVGADLEQVVGEVEDLLAGARRGMIYRQGVRVAIVGRPNVGKSSLLNRLLGTNRAIVTEIPGTTRDTLEETLNLDGVPVVLVDTAGISAASDDVIERLGIERSREALAQADLALLVLDASEPLTDADRAIAALVGDRPAIGVLNKIDVWGIAHPVSERAADHEVLGPLAGSLDAWAPGVRHRSLIPVSALTGEGIAAVEQAIVDTVMSGQASPSDVPLISNPRHEALLRRALGQLQAAQATCRAGLPLDLLSIDLAAAVDSLGEITGETASEELLDTIFSEFCIGK